VKKNQPKGFPWVNKAIGLKYSNALFCMTCNMLHRGRGTSPVLLWVPNIDVLNNDLGPRNGRRIQQRTIFDRWGCTTADGKPLKVTSHQSRHLLNTIASKKLSGDELAKWSGRADRRQNRVYIHRSELERVAEAESLDASMILFGPKGEVPPRPLVSSGELVHIVRGPVHVTEFGVCVRNWAFGPCEKFRNCISCQEHVFIKGEDQCLKRIKERMVEVDAELAISNSAIEEGSKGADLWQKSHEKEFERLRQLVTILEDPAVPDGSQIKLRDGNDFSHLRRALAVRVGPDLIDAATTPDLPSRAAHKLETEANG
jgi:hypothetical protein